MSYENFRPAIFQRGAAVLEIYARYNEENHYEIVVRGNGAYVNSQSLFELINRYIDGRFFNVMSVEVWLYNLQADTSTSA